VDFGIRSVTTYLTAPSAEAPNGVRVFEVNGVPFVFRGGGWSGSLAQYVEEAQVQNYEDTRAQFEALIDHWDNYPTPSTGTDYWQLNKGWPTPLWDLYNYDYDEAGSYFGAKKGDEDVHVLYALDTGQVTVDNLSGVTQKGLSVESRVYDLDGGVTDAQATTRPISLASQQVVNGVLTPKVPAGTAPPAPAESYFVEVILRQDGVVVDRNVYWLSTQQDVMNWDTTEGNPQADNGSPLSQYENMTALQGLPTQAVNAVAATFPGGAPGQATTYVTITDPKSAPAVAFFVRADIRRGTSEGAELPGDNEVLPVTYSDNDITLWPGQSETITATYNSSELEGATPVVSVFGWNVGAGSTCGAAQSCSQSPIVVAARNTFSAQLAEKAAGGQPGIEYFGLVDGTPLAPGSARPQTGLAAVPAPPASLLSVSETAYSPDTSPPTSLTQGDNADTYTITVTNVGHVATDGVTPVTVTDVVGNNEIDLNYVSISGTGWTCDDSQAPTIVCTETGGSGGGPAVLAPGQSYPPLTLTVSVTTTAGYGSQDSVAGLDAINAVTVSGGTPSNSSYSIAPVTPIVGLPDLTNDYAVDGAFGQGDPADQYQETVINQGGGPTNGNPATPVTAKFTAGQSETIVALYGSGWACNLVAITSPAKEPADTCNRSDVLQGENGEEPPITEVVSVSPTATSDTTSATEPKVVVSGGGDAVGAKSTSDSTTILAGVVPTVATSPVLTATSTQVGTFSQGDPDDVYTLSVTNATSAPATSGPVNVTDNLPAGLNPQEMHGAGWTCSLAPVTLPGSPNTFEPDPTCSRSDPLAPGSSYPPITLLVSVTDNALPSLLNSVSVTGGGMTGTNTTTEPTVVTQLPYLSVTSFPSSHGIIYAPFAQGDGPAALDDYNITLANDGFSPTNGPVVLSVAIPSGLNAYSISGPSGWACSVPAATCTGSNPVPAGEELNFTLQVTVSSVAPAWDQALISASGGGEVPAALDLNNDYNIVENGGVFAQPTFITQTSPVAVH
jgi:hypothetical protein